MGSYPFVAYPSCGGEWLLTDTQITQRDDFIQIIKCSCWLIIEVILLSMFRFISPLLPRSHNGIPKCLFRQSVNNSRFYKLCRCESFKQKAMRWQKEDGRCKQNKETTALSSAKGVFPLDMELLSRETLATRTISIQFLEEKKIQFYHITSSTLISFYF